MNVGDFINIQIPTQYDLIIRIEGMAGRGYFPHIVGGNSSEFWEKMGAYTGRGKDSFVIEVGILYYMAGSRFGKFSTLQSFVKYITLIQREIILSTIRIGKHVENNLRIGDYYISNETINRIIDAQNNS